MGAACSSKAPRDDVAILKKQSASPCKLPPHATVETGNAHADVEGDHTSVIGRPIGGDAFGDDDEHCTFRDSSTLAARIDHSSSGVDGSSSSSPRAESAPRVSYPPRPPAACSRGEPHLSHSPSPGATPAGLTGTAATSLIGTQLMMNGSLSAGTRTNLLGARQHNISTTSASSPFCSLTLSAVRPHIDSITSAQSSPRNSVDNPLILMAPHPSDGTLAPADLRRTSDRRTSGPFTRRNSTSPPSHRQQSQATSCARSRPPKRQSLLADPAAFHSLSFVTEAQIARELTDEAPDTCARARVEGLSSPFKDVVSQLHHEAPTTTPRTTGAHDVRAYSSSPFGRVLSSASCINSPPTDEALPFLATVKQRPEEREASVRRVEAMQRDALFGPLVEEGTLSTESCDSSLSSA